MENNWKDSASSMSRINELLHAINEKISLPCENIEELKNKLNESFSNEGDLLIPEKNHKELKCTLEIVCRLPLLFLKHSNNYNALETIDISSIMKKYKNIVSNIEETNNILTEIAMDFENVIGCL